MSTYETLRHFADGLALAGMIVLFLILCLWPFRPGAKSLNASAAQSIFEGGEDGE
ncbi:cbb3-type cytochrome c oxidase subunit 3 [Novosphingobium sp.]|uniref:cbb3-type cytochrome c oxidase subunit 3 n=1 Tax=Novosphingobium sp. TaxID=1874826 RepID=UPI0025D68F16|nr:cbb3-type cytochrome c oxidase subunit 3 [Novosphingobium sp.]